MLLKIRSLLRLGFVFTLALIFISVASAQSMESDPYRKGMQWSRSQNWAEAAKEFRKAIEETPEYALAHANLGVSLSQLGSHKDALLAFEEALHLGYDSPFLRYNRGVSFARLNLLEEAASELETALKLDSRLVKAVYDLGIVYSMMGRKDDALQQVNKLYRRNNKLAKKLFDQVPPKYKVISVENGGRLAGKVSLSGTPPRARSFHLIHAPNIEFCSRISDGKGHRLLFDFTASESGGLKDTVIAIQGVEKGKNFSPKMQTFHISRCRADKYVIGIRNSEQFLIENTDPIQHEIATYEILDSYVDQRSNRPVVAKTSQIRNAFVRHDVDEFIIKCNLHPFLQTRSYMVDNPYYAVSDADGNFSIPEIPPGTYAVTAWHPFSPVQKKTITIKAGEDAKLDFTFDGDEARRKLYHDDIKGYRFNTWYDSFEKFYGGPRVDDPVEELQKF